jgi:hypothetical protein
MSDRKKISVVVRIQYHKQINHIVSLYILEIKNHVDVEKNFEFQHITSDKIEKIIDKINIKKASGFDSIPAKVIKQCKPIISNQLTSLINLSIDTGVFPDSLKKAQVTPLHKKNDPLSKTNYRPVSVLPVFPKIFEKVFETQLSDFFDTIFNPFLCAFRRGHGCQTTLLRLLEDWREALDKNYYIASVLMDLSKAFDYLIIWSQASYRYPISWEVAGVS